jgi:hypothetical protein
MLNRNTLQINTFKAANIDCGHPIALGIDAFSVRVNAASGAKAVLDHMFIERVRTDARFGREYAQLFSRHKPEERSLSGAHRTVARHRAVDLAFGLEGHFPAVTTTLVFHARPPPVLLFVGSLDREVQDLFDADASRQRP